MQHLRAAQLLGYPETVHQVQGVGPQRPAALAAAMIRICSLTRLRAMTVLGVKCGRNNSADSSVRIELRTSRQRPSRVFRR